MTTVSLKLRDALAAELAAAAKRRVSKAKLARELLSASLAPARPKLSAYEVMQAACGGVTDAPRDLATSKRHLSEAARQRGPTATL